MTTLQNGIRVASEEVKGHFQSVGFFYKAGAQYETALSRGAAHLVDRMAFQVFALVLSIAFGRAQQ